MPFNLVPIRIEKGDGQGHGVLLPEEASLNAIRIANDLHLKEVDLEELIRGNIDLLPEDVRDERFPKRRNMLIIGRQTRNERGGRPDLVAVDGEGSLVLIELKRSADDMESRSEPFETQAVRYAASC